MSEILSEDKFDEMICYCHDGDNNSRWQIEAHDAALRAALDARRRG